MANPWVLTRQAEAALKDIAVWTVETFGRRQADAYAAVSYTHLDVYKRQTLNCPPATVKMTGTNRIQKKNT